MGIRIFADFGSTFTKVAAFDMEKEELASRVQAPSTVDTDVTVGFSEALELLRKEVAFTEDDVKNTVCCSSAAGGLKMICIGLVPEYTTEAGRLAALGAGAKIIGTYSYELSRSECREIAAACPDIVLLTGGTDGGNKKIITHNARMLAETENIKNVIVAGNKSAHDDIKDAFENCSVNVHYTKNVMPEFGKLDLDPVNEKIREIFIGHITEAKGIAAIDALTAGVIMPTPSAVLESAKLISEGIPGLYNGMGELLLVDVGGATTDVYSVASGLPTRAGVNLAGLPEPYAKRTVEGDLGLFHNLDTLTEIAKTTRYMSSDEKNELDEHSRRLHGTLSIPGESSRSHQLMLTRLAVKTAVDRHTGRLDSVLTGNGQIWVQRGKDLSKVKTLIGAGGPVAFSSDPGYVLGGALASDDSPGILKPVEPQLYTDSKYILFAIGLMAQSQPEKALRIVKKYLLNINEGR